MTTATIASAPGRAVGHGIFLLSFAILLLQVALTRLLSVVLWYHFAFVAISLAMLGLALAGVGLYLWPRLFAATERLLPWYCRGAGVTMIAALAYVMAAHGGTDAAAPMRIAVSYLVLLVPFTLAGFAVSAVLTFHAAHIGRLYARDLAGGALGCVLAVPLLDVLGAPGTLVAGALVLLASGTCFARRRALDGALVALAAAALAWQVAAGVFEPKAMHGVPDGNTVTGAPADFAAWNSHSRIVVTPESDWAKRINIDGHATTGIYRFDRQVTRDSVREQLPWLRLHAGGMPYVVLGEDASVLLIGPGGGLDLLNGIWHGARIVGVELNGLIHSLMSDGPFARWSGNVYRAPGVRVVHDEARSWIRRSDERFDLIQASMIDTWAATAAGAFALAENALYTAEAFRDYREHLTDRGIVHFVRWHEDPPRQSLRVLALIDAATTAAGDERVADHVVVLREPSFPAGDNPMASVLWSKQPFTADALAKLRQAVDERSRIARVEILCWPGEAHDNVLSEFLRAPDRAAYLRDYPFEVSPTTDDRPFFFHTARLRGGPPPGASDSNEAAVGVLVTVLWVVLAVTIVAFVLPMLLTLRGRAGGAATATARLCYFAALGVGFMLVEIPMLQRFGLYLGHPSWALSAVVGSLLLGAGIGGTRTSSVADEQRPRALVRALLAIVAALALLAALSPAVLAATLRWPFAARGLLTVALLLPVGTALGQALPLGVGALRGSAPPLVPWAWGINGVTSVLASVLAVAIGMQAGFATALVCGIGCYVAALLLAKHLHR